jgi:hypothetical protein
MSADEGRPQRKLFIHPKTRATEENTNGPRSSAKAKPGGPVGLTREQELELARRLRERDRRGGKKQNRSRPKEVSATNANEPQQVPTPRNRANATPGAAVGSSAAGRSRIDSPWAAADVRQKTIRKAKRSKAPEVHLLRPVTSGAVRILDELPGVPPIQPKRAPWFDGLLETPVDDVAPDRFFFVGIDAGTSGIRVGLHDELNKQTTLYDFGRNPAGGTRFSFPALAGAAGRLLELGGDVVDLPPDRRFVSFKGALVHRQMEEDLCRRWKSLRLPYADELCQSRAPSVADFLYAVSIARALELALHPLVDRNSNSPAYLGFAVGAPFVGDDPLRHRFARGLATALLLTGAVGARPNLERVIECFAHAWGRARQIAEAPPEQRRINVRSEAHCAILPLRRLFQIGRSFLIADIGASTADISVVKIGTHQRPYCYAAASSPVGVDMLDLLIKQGGSAGADVLSKRIDRVSGESVTAPAGSRRPTTVAPLQSSLRSVLHQAIHKNRSEAAWRTVYVVVVGGGSKIPVLHEVVMSASAPGGFIEQRQSMALDLESPDVVGASSRSPSRAENFELVSVLGASIPEWEIGEFSTPDQVPTVQPTYWGLKPRAVLADWRD